LRFRTFSYPRRIAARFAAVATRRATDFRSRELGDLRSRVFVSVSAPSKTRAMRLASDRAAKPATRRVFFPPKEALGGDRVRAL
jgi:hypothetical protein